MIHGYQYGECKFINDFFMSLDSYRGLIVDVGAADGIDNSNSHELINKYGWSGILIEPLTQYFLDLKKLYSNNSKIQLVNVGCFAEEADRPFYLNGQCSSFVYKNSALSSIIKCLPLKTILDNCKCPKDIDILSIDCEGDDMSVLRSMDWEKFNVKMVIVEHSMAKNTLFDYMSSIQYVEYGKTIGNTIFTKKLISI